MQVSLTGAAAQRPAYVEPMTHGDEPQCSRERLIPMRHRLHMRDFVAPPVRRTVAVFVRLRVLGVSVID